MTSVVIEQVRFCRGSLSLRIKYRKNQLPPDTDTPMVVFCARGRADAQQFGKASAVRQIPSFRRHSRPDGAGCTAKPRVTWHSPSCPVSLGRDAETFMFCCPQVHRRGEWHDLASSSSHPSSINLHVSDGVTCRCIACSAFRPTRSNQKDSNFKSRCVRDASRQCPRTTS